MKRLALLFALLLVGCRPAVDLNQPAKVIMATHYSDGWSQYVLQAGKHTPEQFVDVYSRQHYRVGDSVALVEVKQ